MRLILVVKKKWFDMIASGEKTEEYREAKPYWNKRFLAFRGLKKQECEVEFRLGYQKNAKGIVLPIENIFYIKDYTTRKEEFNLKLKPEWGYEPSKPTFVIVLRKQKEGITI